MKENVPYRILSSVSYPSPATTVESNKLAAAQTAFFTGSTSPIAQTTCQSSSRRPVGSNITSITASLKVGRVNHSHPVAGKVVNGPNVASD